MSEKNLRDHVAVLQMYSILRKLIGDGLYRDWIITEPGPSSIINITLTMSDIEELPYSLQKVLMTCSILTDILKYQDDIRTHTSQEELMRLSKDRADSSSIMMRLDQLPSLRGFKMEVGQFGVVYSGTLDGEPVIFKVPVDGEIQLSHEAVMGSILNSINSQFFVKTYGYAYLPYSRSGRHPKKIQGFKQDGMIRPYLFLEPIMERATEYGHFLYRRIKKYDNQGIYEVLIQICDGLIEAYDKISFTHGDIHQSNVMVIRKKSRETLRLHTGGELRTRWLVKMIDLGSSRIDSETDRILPPDVILSNTTPTPGYDIFRILRITLSILTSPDQSLFSVASHVVNAMSHMCNLASNENISDEIRKYSRLVHRITTTHLDMIVDIESELNYMSGIDYLKKISSRWNADSRPSANGYRTSTT